MPSVGHRWRDRWIERGLDRRKQFARVAVGGTRSRAMPLANGLDETRTVLSAKAPATVSATTNAMMATLGRRTGTRHATDARRPTSDKVFFYVRRDFFMSESGI